MIYKIFKISFFLLITSTYCDAKTVTYKIDSKKTCTIFSFKNLGFPSPSGKFNNISGEVYLDEEDFEKSKINIEIPVKTLTTSLNFLDKKLKSEIFFDEEKYPLIYFKSTAIESINKQRFNIYGYLTIREVSQPIILNAQIVEITLNSNKTSKIYSFKASTVFERSKFGLNNIIPLMANEISVNIETEIYQKNQKKF